MTSDYTQWPLDQFPALNPNHYADPSLVTKLRKTRTTLLAEPKDDDRVHVSWTSISARDGAALDVLLYTPKVEKCDPADEMNQNEPSRALLLAFHGGGKCTNTLGDPASRGQTGLTP